jgi:hypothetical protein
MTSSSFPGGRNFVFELEVEISSILALSPGEFGSLILDGLYELDHKGELFPAVTVPVAGDRLLVASIKAIGFQRSAEPDGLRQPKSKNVTAMVERKNSEDVNLSSELEAAYIQLGDVLAEQRMLWAKLIGLEEIFRSGALVSGENRAMAQRALAAHKALVRHHRLSTILAL